MKKIATRIEVSAVETAADRSGLTFAKMMENAGSRTAEEISSIFQDMGKYRVLVVAGPGNNGGDGLAAAHHLQEAGAEVRIYLLRDRISFDENYRRVVESECLIAVAEEDKDFETLRVWLNETDIVLDAVLGTGFSLPLKGAAASLLKAIRLFIADLDDPPFIVSVDCPSGLDVDTGEMAEDAISADITVSFGAAKQGFFTTGAQLVGQLKVVDIGIPENLPELEAIHTSMPEDTDIQAWLPDRPLDAHKGTFGKVMVIAGSINCPGAAALAAKSAYRAGAGLVTLAVPGNIQALIAPQLWETTWILLPHEMGVIAEGACDIVREKIGGYQACVIGPGFGQEAITRSFLYRLLFENKNQRGKIGFLHDGKSDSRGGGVFPPSVIDADGLNLLAGLDGWPVKLPDNIVLTPHPGEMARLTGLDVGEIQGDRIGCARHFSKEWGAVVVLKGAFTVVSEPGGETAVIPVATPALARAGSGDVLAGMIGSLLAQGLKPFQAAVTGAYLHGTAGKIALEVTGNAAGVVASDISEMIPSAFNEVQ